MDRHFDEKRWLEIATLKNRVDYECDPRHSAGRIIDNKFVGPITLCFNARQLFSSELINLAKKEYEEGKDISVYMKVLLKTKN